MLVYLIHKIGINLRGRFLLNMERIRGLVFLSSMNLSCGENSRKYSAAVHQTRDSFYVRGFRECSKFPVPL